MENKNRAVIVMGLGPSGLFLVRQLHYITDYIYAIGRTDDVGMYSKYIRKKRRYWAETREAVLHAFQCIFKETDEKPLLYIASDQYLTLFLEFYDDLNKYVELAGSDLNILRLINDKGKLTKFCKEHEINIPEFSTFAMFEKKKIKKYPIIIKWNEKVLHSGKNPIGKVKVCENEKAFLTLTAQMKKIGLDLSLIHVQSYIEGNNRTQYSVGGYYLNGEPLASIVVNQVRQYPQGISAMVVSVDDNATMELENITYKFAQTINYTGFLEIEYKVDEKTSIPYVLDINPRPWGWVSLLGVAYQDFYKVLQGQRVFKIQNNTIWESPIRCLMSFRNAKNTVVPINYANYQKAYDIYDKFDKKPNLILYIMAVKKLIGRI